MNRAGVYRAGVYRAGVYRAASERRFSQAGEELAQGDVTQASENYWGAAAQMVKAIAERRGDFHKAHQVLREIVKALAEETADEDLLR